MAEPSFGHTKVLVIGEEAAREGLKDTIDFFHRHRELSRRMKLVIANGDAHEVIKVSPEIEELADYLDNLIELVTLSGRLQRKTWEAARELFSTGNASAAGAAGRNRSDHRRFGRDQKLAAGRVVGGAGDHGQAHLPPTNCGWACWWWKSDKSTGEVAVTIDLPAPKSRSCLRAIGSPSSSTSSLKLMSLSS